MELFAEPVLFALVLVPIVGLALYVNQSRHYTIAALFLVLFAFDYTVTTLPVDYDTLAFPGTNWNWTGKLLSLSWAILFVHFSFLSFREVGFTFKQRPGSVRSASVITAIIFLVSLAIGAAFTDDMTFSSETLFYFLTMPGFAEEAAYRGVFLALLHRALTAGSDGVYNWWPAMITILAFVLVHPFGLDGWSITFNFADFMLPLLEELLSSGCASTRAALCFRFSHIMLVIRLFI